MHTWTWVLILTLGLIKVPIAALMLWIPFRSDSALHSLPPGESAEGDSPGGEDGGSKTLPGLGGPRHPRAPLGGRWPRRGPHGSPVPPSPARTRRARPGATRVRAHR
ncbi:MAG: hypothetical protein ACHQE6_03435 [Solirubrobacterales bacterium]